MTELPSTAPSIPRARKRALIVPREHGAWGLLLVPLFTGAAAGIASTQRIWPTILFTLAALSLFWLRTPVESLLGASPLTARGPAERRIAFQAAIGLTVMFAACLAALLWKGQNLKLLLIGCAAAFAFAVQDILRRQGRKTRRAAQLAGAMGLTLTAPAAYYVASGHLDHRALALWLANWIFAGNQIHFVQLRIHAARAAGFAERFAQGPIFLLAQPTVLLVVGLASFYRLAPPLLIIAFIPATVRGTKWFFRKPEPLDVKKLGWSEMRQGLIFGTLAALVFIPSSMRS